MGENFKSAPVGPPRPGLHRQLIPVHGSKFPLFHGNFAKVFVKRLGIGVGAAGGEDGAAGIEERLGQAGCKPVEMGGGQGDAKRRISSHDECVDDRRGKGGSVVDIDKAVWTA